LQGKRGCGRPTRDRWDAGDREQRCRNSRFPLRWLRLLQLHQGLQRRALCCGVASSLAVPLSPCRGASSGFGWETRRRRQPSGVGCCLPPWPGCPSVWLVTSPSFAGTLALAGGGTGPLRFPLAAAVPAGFCALGAGASWFLPVRGQEAKPWLAGVARQGSQPPRHPGAAVFAAPSSEAKHSCLSGGPEPAAVREASRRAAGTEQIVLSSPETAERVTEQRWITKQFANIPPTAVSWAKRRAGRAGQTTCGKESAGLRLGRLISV